MLNTVIRLSKDKQLQTELKEFIQPQPLSEEQQRKLYEVCGTFVQKQQFQSQVLEIISLILRSSYACFSEKDILDLINVITCPDPISTLNVLRQIISSSTLPVTQAVFAKLSAMLNSLTNAGVDVKY